VNVTDTSGYNKGGREKVQSGRSRVNNSSSNTETQFEKIDERSGADVSSGNNIFIDNNAVLDSFYIYKAVLVGGTPSVSYLNKDSRNILESPLSRSTYERQFRLTDIRNNSLDHGRRFVLRFDNNQSYLSGYSANLKVTVTPFGSTPNPVTQTYATAFDSNGNVTFIIPSTGTNALPNGTITKVEYKTSYQTVYEEYELESWEPSWTNLSTLMPISFSNGGAGNRTVTVDYNSSNSYTDGNTYFAFRITAGTASDVRTYTPAISTAQDVPGFTNRKRVTFTIPSTGTNALPNGTIIKVEYKLYNDPTYEEWTSLWGLNSLTTP
jgi:hypothetical protein